MEIRIASKGSVDFLSKERRGHVYRMKTKIKKINATSNSSTMFIWLEREYEVKTGEYSVSREGDVELSRDEVQQILQVAMSEGFLPKMVPVEQAKTAVTEALDELLSKMST